MGARPVRSTIPYSEIVKNASSKGTMLPSIEEERERFYALDRNNQARLLKSIRNAAAETMLALIIVLALVTRWRLMFSTRP